MPTPERRVLHVLPHPGGGGEAYADALEKMPGYRFARRFLATDPRLLRCPQRVIWPMPAALHPAEEIGKGRPAERRVLWPQLAEVAVDIPHGDVQGVPAEVGAGGEHLAAVLLDRRRSQPGGHVRPPAPVELKGIHGHSAPNRTSSRTSQNKLVERAQNV